MDFFFWRFFFRPVGRKKNLQKKKVPPAIRSELGERAGENCHLRKFYA
jgi:hypothetical protein